MPARGSTRAGPQQPINGLGSGIGVIDPPVPADPPIKEDVMTPKREEQSWYVALMAPRALRWELFVSIVLLGLLAQTNSVIGSYLREFSRLLFR
jgi:hypothetical protein